MQHLKQVAVRKRLKSRPKVIDLNGHQPHAALLYLSITAPLLLGMVCLVQQASWHDIMAVFRNLIGLSLIAVLYREIFRLRNNRLVFTADSIKLPGLEQQVIKLESIVRVSLQERKDIMCLGTGDGRWHFIHMKGLCQEGAKQLWHLIATKLKHAEVKAEVKDILLNWVSAEKVDDRVHASLLSWTLAEQRLAREKKAVAIIDPRVCVDLKINSIAGRLGQYITFYITTCLQVWVAICSILTVTILIGTLGVGNFNLLKVLGLVSYVTQQNLMALLFAPADLLKELLWFLLQLLNPIFGNPPAAVCYCAMLVWMTIYAARSWAEPDCVEVSRQGITTLKKGPSGAVPQSHLQWQDLESITITGRPGPELCFKARPAKIEDKDESSKELPSHNQKSSAERDRSISIPLKLLTGSGLRRQMLEAIDQFAGDTIIDPAVLQALAPRAAQGEDGLSALTYTELWLDSLESAPRLNELTPLAPGTRLANGIMISSQLASGGQGVTYLADRNGKTVVLKETILPVYIESARKNVTARFNENAALLSTLDHPQIVKLHDSFIQGHRAFLVMEYVEGSTLQELVERQGPLPESQVVHIARQLAGILSYLHSRIPPVVHRDLSPDNLIIDGSGLVKLVDFGVAIEQGNSRSAVVGKQNFLPPEQIAGQACPQSDIYAMGATLFFLLTGQEPEPLERSNPRLLNDLVSERMAKLVQDLTEMDLARRLDEAAKVLDYLPQAASALEDEAEESQGQILKIPESEPSLSPISIRQDLSHEEEI